MAKVIITTDVHGYNMDRINTLEYDYLLDCGDFFHGNKAVNLTKGEMAIPFGKKYDCIACGNHDYRYKIDRFLEISRQVNFVACNLLDRKTNELLFKPYLLFGNDGQGNYELGVIGVASNSGLPKGVKAIATINVPKEIQKWADLIRNKCKRVIVIAHYPCSKKGANAISRMIEKVHGIDAFFGGHAHILCIREQKDMEKKLVPYAEGGECLNNFIEYDTETNAVRIC